MRARVWRPDGSCGPGRLDEVELVAVRVHDSGLMLPNVTVIDGGAGALFEADDLLCSPALGGGPLASPTDRRQARAFGVVNVAYHLQRGLDYVAAVLGRPLPPLVAKIGLHAAQQPRWGGAHYRLPADSYATLPEHTSPLPTGEIHLGRGGRFVWYGEGRYFHAPAHNPAIICHELGHHVCRHTADFRLNQRRPPHAQANRKVPLDEGTSDYLAAVLVRSPDIYGWHRGAVPSSHQARRRLDVPWTMSAFRGGAGHDPHIDGTVWAAALWSTRRCLMDRGVPGEAFDRLVLQALVRIGESEATTPWDEALRLRRHFARALQAILDAAKAAGGAHTDTIERTFATHGIRVGYSNSALRERCRHAGVPVCA